MRFSIVITTYNRLRFLKKAIKSALEQSFPCEVIVVDDCSNDGTQEYCQSLGKKIIYIRNKKNMGHSISVNSGVKKANGKWIKLLDDDDYLAPNCIAEIAKAVEDEPNAVICSCLLINVNENGKELNKNKNDGKVFVIPQEDIHYGMLLDLANSGTASQVCVRKDAFQKSGGWDKKFDTNYDDTDSWIKITRFGDAVFIKKYLIYRMLWPGGYNIKFSIRDRMRTNIIAKKAIYELVNKNHRKPSMNVITKYMNLHWGIVALKHGKIIADMIPAIFSPPAWGILIKAYLYRKGLYQDPNVRIREK